MGLDQFLKPSERKFIKLVCMKQVTFVGYGKIGSALAHLMGNRARVCAWDKDPKKIIGGVQSMEEAVQEADVIFLCVPSWVIRDVANELSELISKQTVVICLAKGLEVGTQKTMDVVLQESLKPDQPSGVMGGPLLADELLMDLPGVGVVGAKDRFVFEAIEPLFAGSTLCLEYMNDSTAVALASVLKNIYAVALGIAEGLGWGWNGKGWLAARGLEEMTDIIEQLHGDVFVVRGSSGAGDFLATAMSPSSFNRETGRKIAQTGECKTPSEGCRAIESVLALLGSARPNLPILFALDRIINQHEHPNDVFQTLLRSASSI